MVAVMVRGMSCSFYVPWLARVPACQVFFPVPGLVPGVFQDLCQDFAASLLTVPGVPGLFLFFSIHTHACVIHVPHGRYLSRIRESKRKSWNSWNVLELLGETHVHVLEHSWNSPGILLKRLIKYPFCHWLRHVHPRLARARQPYPVTRTVGVDTLLSYRWAELLQSFLYRIVADRLLVMLDTPGLVQLAHIIFVKIGTRYRLQALSRKHTYCVIPGYEAILGVLDFIVDGELAVDDEPLKSCYCTIQDTWTFLH